MKKLLRHRGRDVAIVVVGLLWICSYFVARAIFESAQLPAVLRVVVALVPVLPFAGFLRLVVADLPRMDELERRVQLEALALAFPLSVILLMLLGLIGQALELTPERHVWYYLPACYFAGVAIAWRRYR
jgi:uncharacterized membrane protein